MVEIWSSIPLELLARSTREAFEDAGCFADALTPAVIVGQTGVGKSHMARWMHRIGRPVNAPFNEVSGQELTLELCEDVLYGRKKGAYTGAVTDRVGLITLARYGTLLLDDVAHMSIAVQAKVLRTFSSGHYRPLGSSRELQVECRFIFGVSGDLDELVAEGRLLSDFRPQDGRVRGQSSAAPRAEERGGPSRETLPG
jgi:two-component system response regulator PilR (NtrC family)